jgi:hypothetical protein
MRPDRVYLAIDWMPKNLLNWVCYNRELLG